MEKKKKGIFSLKEMAASRIFNVGSGYKQRKYPIGALFFAFFLFAVFMLPGAVSVSAAPKISPSSKTLYVGQAAVLKASGFKKSVAWSSKKKNVATVSKGKVTAKKKGTAVITAKAGSQRAVCKVTVRNIALSKTSASMTAGKTLKLTLNCGASSGISWTTSNSKTVAITSRSKNYVYLKAVKKGTAVVRAKYKTRTYACKITVKAGSTASSVPSYVPDSIKWSSYMSVPSVSERKAYAGTLRAPYITCEPVFSGVSTFYEFSVDFRADYLPNGTYLCVDNWDFYNPGLSRRYKTVKRDYNGVAGYAGFQKAQDGTGKIILTVWDTFCYDQYGQRTVYRASQVYPAGNKGFEICKGDLVTGEGWFVHTILPFDWKKSHNYRALLQLSNPPDGSNSHLLYYVCDLHTGVWTKLVEYDLGYNDVQMNRSVSFLEDFSHGMAGYPRSMALSNYRVHPTGSMTWVSANKAVMNCSYSNNGSYQYGSTGNAFWAITTGIGGRCYTPQKNLTCYVNRYETGQPY